MEIKNIKLDQIKEYDKNSKLHPKDQIEKIKKSIKEFGFNVPLILDKDYVLIAGHGRLRALKELEIKEVPVIFKENLTEAQAKAYRIADNKLSESDWDFDFLKEEFKFMQEKGFDWKLTGFDEKTINKLIDSDKNVSEDTVDVNAYERAKSKTKIKLGEIFQLGDHRLMCGDSTKETDVSKLMNKQKAILMVTDPPYGVNYNPKWRDEADKKGILGNKYPTRALGEFKNDDIIEWTETYKLFDTQIIYNWHASWFTNKVQDALESCGYKIIALIIWVKPHFALSQGDYHWQHELCWYAVKNGKKHNWQGSRKESTVWEIAGMNAMGSSQDKADERTGHGTQKPIKCMSIPIINNSKLNDLIADPFGGSGSTLIACEQLNRKCFMMEIDPVYCQVIIDRWQKLTGKESNRI